MRYRRALVIFVACVSVLLLGAAGPDNPSPSTQPQTAQSVDPDPSSGGRTPLAAVRASGAVPLPTGAKLAVIKIEGLIYGYTLDSLERRVDRAIQQGASVVVLELDTPGGLVHSALKISKFIKTMPIRSVAWVNPEALSAGIMIASACDQIVMAPAAVTGDCAPINPTGNMGPTERAKALSPILEEFRDSARRSGYDYAIFNAMCVLGVELYEVRQRETGAVRIVNQADYGVMVDGQPISGDWLTKAIGAAASAVRPVDVGGATVTVATEADRGRWELVRQVHDGKTLLTVNQTRAFEIGLSKNDPASDPIATTADLQTFLGAAGVTRIKRSTVAMIAYWLTAPWVRAILIVVMLVSGYLELQAPGIGVAGAASLLALVLLLVAPYLVGLAQVWHVLLFLVGLLLLGIEIFVIPGLGMFGGVGILCMFIGLILMAVPSSGQGPFPMPAQEMADYLRVSVLWSVLAVIVSGIGFYYLTRYFGQVPVLNRLILAGDRESGTGLAARPGERVSGDEVLGAGHVAVGTVGTVIATLRPSGQIDVQGRTVDVVSVGNWIEAGRRVRVIEVKGNRITVDVLEQA